jgi:hypothetical protein
LSKLLGAPRSRAGFWEEETFLAFARCHNKILQFSDTFPSHSTDRVNLATYDVTTYMMLLRTSACFRKLRLKCNEEQFFKV